MNWKTEIKRMIPKYNPLAILRRKRMRKALKNTTPSLLVPNCLGGILFHDLNLRFNSPTVNLMMYQTDFARFVADLDDYIERKLEFFQHPEYEFPCAILGDIVIHFTHYASQQQAEEKWLERCKRIDRDNLFIVALERDGLTETDIRDLGQVKAKGIVVFTAHDYKDVPYACYVPNLSSNGEVQDLLARSYLDDHRRYEEVFDFVKWFNKADGNVYDIQKYKK